MAKSAAAQCAQHINPLAASQRTLASKAAGAAPAPPRATYLCDCRLPPWLADCLEDVRHILTLESLTLRAAMHMTDFAPVPNIRLESMRNLKHVKLVYLLPTETFSLPRGCLLHLHARCSSGKCDWVQHSQAIELHTLVLRMFGNYRRAWPARIRQFSNLQPLAIELPLELFSKDKHPGFLDVADLQHIPHVRLHDFPGVMSLKITTGFWQSLEINGV